MPESCSSSSIPAWGGYREPDIPEELAMTRNQIIEKTASVVTDREIDFRLMAQVSLGSSHVDLRLLQKANGAPIELGKAEGVSRAEWRTALAAAMETVGAS